jgi:phage gp45-like
MRLIQNIKFRLFGNEETNGLKAEGYEGQILEVEEYQHFGFCSRGTKGTTHIVKFLTKNKADIISIASKNYNIEFNMNDGETLIYSTDENSAIKSKIYLRDNGTIEINGNSEAIVLGNTMLEKINEILDVVKNHTHQYIDSQGSSATPVSSETEKPSQEIKNLSQEVLSEKNFGG